MMILNCLGMCLNSQEQRKYKDQLESALCILGTFRGSWYIWILETFFFHLVWIYSFDLDHSPSVLIEQRVRH